MAMSRITSRSSLRPPTALISHHRLRSSKSHRAQLIELDLDSASSSSEELIAGGIKKLEEVMHGMAIRRAAPDWLPFLPGHSYWMPPPSLRFAGSRKRPSASIIELIGRLSAMQDNLLSDDEYMSRTSSKGWPSSSFFIRETSLVHPIRGLEMGVNIQDNEDNSDQIYKSEAEEG